MTLYQSLFLLFAFSCICKASTCDCDPTKLVLWSEIEGGELSNANALSLFSAETDSPFAGTWYIKGLDESPNIPLIVRPNEARFVEQRFRARQQKSTFDRFATAFNWTVAETETLLPADETSCVFLNSTVSDAALFKCESNYYVRPNSDSLQGDFVQLPSGCGCEDDAASRPLVSPEGHFLSAFVTMNQPSMLEDGKLVDNTLFPAQMVVALTHSNWTLAAADKASTRTMFVRILPDQCRKKRRKRNIDDCGDDSDCGRNEVCRSEGCSPSSCDCSDPIEGSLMCTADCGGAPQRCIPSMASSFALSQSSTMVGLVLATSFVLLI